MRTLATTALTLVTIGGTAVAADLSRPVYKPVPPLPPVMQNWSGFYVGLNAGGGIGTGSSDFSIAGVPAFASVDNHLQGAIGGGQAGFNWQAGAAVLGVEADFQASGLKGSLTTPCLPGLCGALLTATYSQKVPWFGTARARIGYAAKLRLCAAGNRRLSCRGPGDRDVHLAREPKRLDRRHRHRGRVRPALERQARISVFRFRQHQLEPGPDRAADYHRRRPPHHERGPRRSELPVLGRFHQR